MTSKLSEKLMPPEVFEATLNYFLVRQGNSKEIAHAYHVLGLPASSIAAHYGCSKQNVVKVLARYATAYERYMAAARNVGQTMVPTAATAANDSPQAAAPALAKAAPKAAKPAAKKSTAKKTAS